MSKVIFRFNKEKDLRNQWHKSNWKSDWADFQIPEEIKEICKGKEFEDCKEDLIMYLSKLHNSKIIEINLRFVEESWRNIEEEFFVRIGKLMKKNFDEKIFAYLTTSGICPYNPSEPSFMFSLFYSLPKVLQTCGHEIMHLYFHKFYWDSVEEKIGKKKTADLKEALTILLNLEFRDLWFVEDRGYNSHEDLRKFISQEWKREKDFGKLLKKCEDYLSR